jgi:hypothetical protein
VSETIYDDPFDPNTDDTANETLPLDVVMRDAIDSMLYDVHTAMPAKIVALKGNAMCDIQPLLQRKYKDGSLKPLPVIQDVPVVHPRGADYWVKLPIAVGDTGLAVFSERSLDTWAQTGGMVDPADPRRHDLSDAVFIPGLYAKAAPLSGAAADMVLHNGAAEITVKKPGKFKFAKVGGDEVLALLVQITDKLSTLSDTLSKDTTNTIFGPMKLNSFSQYTTLKTDIDELKTKLEALKG